MKLLTRDDFRNSVFARDKYLCVVCGNKADDAHHIVERRLFPDGGYYIDNGASVCEPCHLKCEQTLISCDELRERCNIKDIVLPPHMYDDNEFTYDKWGNIVLPNGTRLRGDLFYDDSVQKVLKSGGVLDLFSLHIKYPRTFHLPWSENVKKDDRVLNDLSHFIGQEVVVTLKMDGENTTMYSDYIHARSLNANPHPSRNWVKNLHSQVAPNIPEGWRVCGENLFAKHSIEYKNLDNYFELFSVWNDRNKCLSWDETVTWAQLLDLKTVPILYRGIWDEKLIKSLHKDTFDGDQTEGYVVRLAREFAYGEFRSVVGKFVRKDHVQTHGHWMRSILTQNGLK